MIMSCADMAKRGRGRPRRGSMKTDVCTRTNPRKPRIKTKAQGRQEYWKHVISQPIPRKPRTKITRILNHKHQSWGQRYCLLLDHNPKPNPISENGVHEGVVFINLDADPVSASQDEADGVFVGSSSSSSPRLKISLSTPLSEYIIPGPIPNNIDELAWEENMNLNFWKDIPDFDE